MQSMKHYTKNEIERVEFDSLTEMAQYIEDNEGKYAADCHGSSASTIEERNRFYYTRDMKEAIELARNGWKKGADLISKSLEHVHAIGKGYTFTPKSEVSGESVDIGKFLSGDPENMLEWELVETTGKKVVDIYFNCVASASTDGQQLIRYGSVCLTVVDYLESIGVRVNLYSYFSTPLQRKDKMIICKLKGADEYLNLQSCAFGLCHPSMMRRFMFRIIELFEGWHQSGYGTQVEYGKTAMGIHEDSVIFQTLNRVGSYHFSDQSGVDRYIKTRMPEVLNELKIVERDSQ